MSNEFISLSLRALRLRSGRALRSKLKKGIGQRVEALTFLRTLRAQSPLLLALLAMTVSVSLQGCAGYHTKIESPFGIKTIYVPTVRNIIPLHNMLIYVPGMEVDITNAIIQRFNFDGSLKVVSRKEDADATLYIDLTHFDQEGVRFTNLESVEEYRLFITADVQLKDNKKDETLFREKNFTGRSSYFRQTSKGDVRNNGQSFREPLQEVLKPATQKTIIDFAHNVVDLITEAW